MFFFNHIGYMCSFFVILQAQNDSKMEIKIKDEDLAKAAAEGMDAFLDVFVQAFLKPTDGQITAETLQNLNGDQITLLAYHVLHEELMDGGFIQLIQNGYGPFIFDNPFAKAMRLWGLKEFSKQIYKAKEIYDKDKADLTRERTDEEFMAMYEDYEVFDDLDDWFITEEEGITAQIAYYVDEHMDRFAVIEN